MRDRSSNASNVLLRIRLCDMAWCCNNSNDQPAYPSHVLGYQLFYMVFMGAGGVDLPEFSFTIEKQDEERMVVHPHGSLDFHTVGLIKKAIFPLINDEEIYCVIFELR